MGRAERTRQRGRRAQRSWLTCSLHGAGLDVPGILDGVVDGARERREAIRQLASLRRRLAAAEDALSEAQAATKQAETAYDAAND